MSKRKGTPKPTGKMRQAIADQRIDTPPEVLAALAANPQFKETPAERFRLSEMESLDAPLPSGEGVRGDLIEAADAAVAPSVGGPAAAMLEAVDEYRGLSVKKLNALKPNARKALFEGMGIAGNEYALLEQMIKSGAQPDLTWGSAAFNRIKTLETQAKAEMAGAAGTPAGVGGAAAAVPATPASTVPPAVPKREKKAAVARAKSAAVTGLKLEEGVEAARRIVQTNLFGLKGAAADPALTAWLMPTAKQMGGKTDVLLDSVTRNLDAWANQLGSMKDAPRSAVTLVRELAGITRTNAKGLPTNPYTNPAMRVQRARQLSTQIVGMLNPKDHGGAAMIAALIAAKEGSAAESQAGSPARSTKPLQKKKEVLSRLVSETRAGAGIPAEDVAAAAAGQLTPTAEGDIGTSKLKTAAGETLADVPLTRQPVVEPTPAVVPPTAAAGEAAAAEKGIANTAKKGAGRGSMLKGLLRNPMGLIAALALPVVVSTLLARKRRQDEQLNSVPQAGELALSSMAQRLQQERMLRQLRGTPGGIEAYRQRMLQLMQAQEQIEGPVPGEGTTGPVDDELQRALRKASMRRSMPGSLLL